MVHFCLKEANPMSSVVATTPGEPAPPAKSFLERFVGVFISPGETFADIARKPGFIAPVVTIAVATWALIDTMYWRLGLETVTRLSLQRSPFTSRMTPEQMDQAVANSAGHFARSLVFADLSIIVVTIIFLLVLAGLGMVIVNAILGGDLRFKTVFSVASYANLVAVLGCVLGVPVILFGGTDNFDPSNPTPLNVAFFLNYKEIPKPLFSLAGSADIVTVWMVILLGLGMSKATGGKVKALPITLCYVGAWAVWIIGKVGLGLLF
jgi:hypothetical protein